MASLKSVALILLIASTGYAQEMDLLDNPKDENRRIVLEEVKKNTIFEKIGLKDGDIIKMWNGKLIRSRFDWDVVQLKIKDTSEFTVVVERDGKEKVLHYAKK